MKAHILSPTCKSGGPSPIRPSAIAKNLRSPGVFLQGRKNSSCVPLIGHDMSIRQEEILAGHEELGRMLSKCPRTVPLICGLQR